MHYKALSLSFVTVLVASSFARSLSNLDELADYLSKRSGLSSNIGGDGGGDPNAVLTTAALGTPFGACTAAALFTGIDDPACSSEVEPAAVDKNTGLSRRN